MFHVKQFLSCIIFLPFLARTQVGSTTLPVRDFPPLPMIDTSIVAFLNQFYEMESMSPRQRDWFYWTNYSRVNPKRFYDSVVEPLLHYYPTLKNSYSSSLKSDLFKSSNLPLLKPNINLGRVANVFAHEMASTKSRPSHTAPSGSTFQSRMESIKVKYCAGENISFGPDNTLLMLVLLYIDEGVTDLGHRKTLLDKNFVEMGIGFAEYPDNKIFVVQDFACSQLP